MHCCCWLQLQTPWISDTFPQIHLRSVLSEVSFIQPAGTAVPAFVSPEKHWSPQMYLAGPVSSVRLPGEKHAERAHAQFIAHFTLISPFLTICMPLCYVTLYNLYSYYFALSTERTWFDYISLLIIPCITIMWQIKKPWPLTTGGCFAGCFTLPILQHLILILTRSM